VASTSTSGESPDFRGIDKRACCTVGPPATGSTYHSRSIETLKAQSTPNGSHNQDGIIDKRSHPRNQSHHQHRRDGRTTTNPVLTGIPLPSRSLMPPRSTADHTNLFGPTIASALSDRTRTFRLQNFINFIFICFSSFLNDCFHYFF